MKFIQIAERPLAPGGLVEWTPTATDGFGRWSPDDRPTSHNHEAHLRAAREHRLRTAQEGGRESWLGLEIDIDQPLSIPAMRAALDAFIDRHEVLRSHVVLDDQGMQRFTAAPGEVRVSMGKIRWYAESAPLTDQVEGAFDRFTAPMHWPAYHFATIGRERDFTLLFAADHSLLDGYSLLMAHHELRELYRAARTRTTPDLPPVGSYVDFSAVERVAAENATAHHPGVQVWSDFRDSGHQARFPLGDTLTSVSDEPDLRAPQSALTGRVLDATAMNRFSEICAAANVSTYAGLLATLAWAQVRVGGPDAFTCVLPRHTRNAADLFAAMGWFVGTTPVTVDMTSPDQQLTIGEVMNRASAALSRSCDGATVPFGRVQQLLAEIPAATFVVSFIDTRFAPQADLADSGAARIVRSHSYSTDEVYLWLNRTPRGLRYSARFPQRLSGAVTEYLGAVGAILHELTDRTDTTGGEVSQHPAAR